MLTIFDIRGKRDRNPVTNSEALQYLPMLDDFNMARNFVSSYTEVKKLATYTFQIPLTHRGGDQNHVPTRPLELVPQVVEVPECDQFWQLVEASVKEDVSLFEGLLNAYRE